MKYSFAMPGPDEDVACVYCCCLLLVLLQVKEEYEKKTSRRNFKAPESVVFSCLAWFGVLYRVAIIPVVKMTANFTDFPPTT